MNPAEWSEAYRHPAALAEYLTQRDKFLRPPHVELLSTTIAEAILGEGGGRFIVTMPPRHGKPVSVDEPVLMGDGSRKRLGDIRVGEDVIGKDGVPARVSEVHEQGTLDSVKVMLDSGRTLTAAVDHPVLTTRGWLNAGDITTDDSVALLPGAVTDSRALSQDEARLMGYFVGDGSTTSGNCNVTCADDAQGAVMMECADALGFVVTVNQYKGNGKAKRYNFSTGDAAPRAWLRSCGIADRGSHAKTVPDAICRAPPAAIAAFVAAYFECDGSVNRRGGARKDCCAEFYSVSSNLLAGVRHLLLRLGIPSRMAKKRSTVNGEPYISFRLSVTSADAVARFAANVPVIGAKRDALDGWGPVRTAFDSRYVADRVVGVAPTTAECRCLTVPGQRSFTANDVVVHNSTTCSAWLPFWFLNLYPDKHVMLVSYGAEFAQKWGRRVRRLANVHKDETMMRMSPDSRSAAEWETTDEGGMKSLGIGGDATGRGADLLVIDDPVKNSEEARSEVMRQKTWEFWQETLRTRIEPYGTVLVVQTRWNEDDLAGRLIAEDDEREQRGEDRRWTCIDFPALAEGEDELGRTEGEPLWPERFSERMLMEIRIDVGSYAWSALYQQRPTPEGGGMFRKLDFRYWYTAPDGSRVLVHGDGTEERIQPTETWVAQVTDTAMETKTVNDWTVNFTFAVTKKRQVIVLDVVRLRIEVPDQLPLIRKQKALWRPRWSGVEVKGSGHGIVQEARREGLMLRPIKAVKDKVTRASPAAALVEQHAVFFPRYAPWLAEFEHELQAFPNGAFDDQVDVLAHAVNELAQQAVYDGPVQVKERQRTGMAEGGFEGAY